jgi:hypothetical protein
MTDGGTGRDVHPDLGQLADIDAGIDVDADVRAHASSCPQCQEALAALRATRDDLAGLPATPIPDDVAARIDVALSKEVPGNEVPQGSGSGADTTVVPMTDQRAKRRRGSVIAGGIAASVVVLLIVGIVINAVSNGTKSNNNGAASGSSAALGTAGTSVVRVSGLNYTQANLDSNVAKLLNSPVAAPAAGSAGQTDATGTAGTSAGGAGTTGKAPHGSPLPSTEARAPTITSHSTQQLSIPAQLQPLQSDPAAMTQCISSLLGTPPYFAPIAVDLATYDGKPAAIFVFPKKDDPANVSVFVVPPGGCSTGFFEFFKNAVPK